MKSVFLLLFLANFRTNSKTRKETKQPINDKQIENARNKQTTQIAIKEIYIN